MRSRIVALLLAVGLTASGCGGGGGTTHPTFTARDYSYRLEMVCRCPLVGPVTVTVRDGRVATAVVARGSRRGERAPAYLRRTIADIIEIAEHPGPSKVEVDWPEGADVPRRVTTRPAGRTTDAAVSYLISDVRVDRAG